ncbi:hypothetical protein DFA_05193 [Cavenderia fasciculata]|uniref:Uncharacterized protein n=1 Tax=Cavenderia fasciculata TaxID=261658 RepID=F4PNL0_CACFS|nr:uncharacterized protein DFA_05193 [Cavenderia fasciculata]EGG23063.1 hypothetical protein DFA_05193 [Cavenderia fasciculata]|eukprot:XP_004360914.1 hypothetical protein DFA_05193 [Cavenderia fasciculata]
MTDSKVEPIVVLQYEHLPEYRVVNLKSSTQSIQVDGDTDEPFLSTRSLLEEIVFSSTSAGGKPNPSDITQKLIEHCSQVTHRARDFMEKFPNKKQPNDYREYPGKMDHTTCVTFQIGRSK